MKDFRPDTAGLLQFSANVVLRDGRLSLLGISPTFSRGDGHTIDEASRPMDCVGTRGLMLRRSVFCRGRFLAMSGW